MLNVRTLLWPSSSLWVLFAPWQMVVAGLLWWKQGLHHALVLIARRLFSETVIQSAVLKGTE